MFDISIFKNMPCVGIADYISEDTQFTAAELQDILQQTVIDKYSVFNAICKHPNGQSIKLNPDNWGGRYFGATSIAEMVAAHPELPTATLVKMWNFIKHDCYSFEVRWAMAKHPNCPNEVMRLQKDKDAKDMLERCDCNDSETINKAIEMLGYANPTNVRFTSSKNGFGDFRNYTNYYDRFVEFTANNGQHVKIKYATDAESVRSSRELVP